MADRLLTKSLFARALECPRKLYYIGKPQYVDNSLADEFLAALAEGGMQVGELARCYYPEGVLVAEKGRTAALARTNELLRRNRVTLFEAAIQHGNCYCRADILIKDGNRFELIEVKAKSYAADEDGNFMAKRGSDVSSVWKPYLYDVAFQRLVLQRAFPAASVNAYLMLADKLSAATADGLNQRFVLREEVGRMTVERRGDCSLSGLGAPILVAVPADAAVSVVSDGVRADTAGRTLSDYVDWLAGHYRADTKVDWPVGVQCKGCQFKANEEQRRQGLLSGYCECWREKKGLSEEDLRQPNVFDIWNFRRKAEVLDSGRFFLRDVTESDIFGSKEPKAKAAPGLSAPARQWLQVEKAKTGDASIFFDRDGFAEESAAWRYPLHFIDFETSAVAIPFTAGRRPYEGVAFQFSHHVVLADGRIGHAGEYLNADPGVFPNYDFVRALKSELDKDAGTVFRYAAHENTYLNFIYAQLQAEPERAVADRDTLCAWIKTVTKSTGGKGEEWEGARSMVDMCALVKRYYYDPRMKGSNSIKWVLPAVLNASAHLQAKYSKPIYGAEGGIPSRNYRDWVWVTKTADGTVDDPYHRLPNVTPGVTDVQLEYAEENNDRLADGAAAMTAYARLQFMHVPDAERQNIKSALLRYCELDTFAMVLIWEHWKNLLGGC